METTMLLQATRNNGSPPLEAAAAATAATPATAASGSGDDHHPIMVSPAVLANHLCSTVPSCDRDLRAFERVIRETMESKDRSEAELFDEWAKHRSLTARVEEARDREAERAARVAVLLADGRIVSMCGQGNLLLEIVLKAKGDERTEDGTFPAACGAIHKLLGTKGVPGAMTAAGYSISLAVGWRMIEVVRPTVASELASGYFFISDLRELVRKAFGLRLCFEQGGKGELTPVNARLTLKADSGVDFYRVVDEAAQRGAARRLSSKVRRYQLASYYHGRELRDAQGRIVGLDAALEMQQQQHERAAEAAKAAGGGNNASMPGYSVVVGQMPIAQMLLGGGGGGRAPAAATPPLRLTDDDVSEPLEDLAEEQQQQPAAAYALRKRAAAATTTAVTSDDDEQPPTARRRHAATAAADDALPSLQAVKTGGGTGTACRNKAAPVTPLVGNNATAAATLSDDDSLEALFAASRNKYGDALELECVSSDAFESWAAPLLAGLSLDAAGGNTTMLGAGVSSTTAIEFVVPSVPILSHLCQALCGAGSLLLSVSGSRAFLQHRSVFAASPPLLGLGVGESFTSLFVVKHDYYHHGVAQASCRSDVCYVPSTRVVSLWVDPARLVGGCGLALSSPSSFELVFDAAAAANNDDEPEPGSVVPLVHGTVLVTKVTETGGACELGYKVRAARGSGGGGGGGAAAATSTARLVEFVFFVSRDVQVACSGLGDVQVRVNVAKAVAALPP